jgi:serine/threonine protein phosphatase 1
MRFVIGDIHGELSKLKKLIEHIEKTVTNPTLIFIGDYLDKGESSKLTLDFLVNLSKKYDCTFLMGNHEYIWLNLLQNFKKHEEYLMKYGAANTISSFDCTKLIETRSKMLSEYGCFFENLKNYWKDNEVIVVHSGISIEDFDKDIEEIVQLNFLFNRYEFIKHEELFQGKYKVVFGHTGFYQPYVDPFKIGIDTAACFLESQPLTAICLDNMHFYNSNQETYTVDYKKFDFCPMIPRNKPWRAQ